MTFPISSLLAVSDQIKQTAVMRTTTVWCLYTPVHYFKESSFMFSTSTASTSLAHMKTCLIRVSLSQLFMHVPYKTHLQCERIVGTCAHVYGS